MLKILRQMCHEKTTYEDLAAHCHFFAFTFKFITVTGYSVFEFNFSHILLNIYAFHVFLFVYYCEMYVIRCDLVCFFYCDSGEISYHLA